MNRRYTLFVLLSALSITACGDWAKPGVPAKGADKEERKDDVLPEVDPVETFLAGIRAYNEDDVRALLSTHLDDATWHMPGTKAPPVEGRKRIARQGVAFKLNLPESRFGVRRILVMGDLLAAQVVFRAVRRFDEQGGRIEPREVGYEVVQLVETERGYARRTVVHHDQLGFRRQMGLLPGDPPAVPALPDGAPEVIREPASEGWEEVLAGLHGAWEKGDFAAWKDLVTDDFAMFDRATGRRFDLAGAVKWLEGLERERDTVLLERFRTVAAGPWVAVFLAQRVDHRAGDKEKPERIALFGAHVLRLEGGKVAALEIYRNKVEILRETGRLGGLLERGEPDSDQ